MKIYAQCKNHKIGYSFPFYDFITNRKFSEYPSSPELYECWQPECIHSDEFNLVIMLHNIPVRVRSSDFNLLAQK